MLTELEEDVSSFAHIYLDSMNREQTVPIFPVNDGCFDGLSPMFPSQPP
jgi:hypothetical protein